MSNREWHKTKHPGLRYRLHSTRKIGKTGNLDRYYSITYKLNGKTVTEGIGWLSDAWTEKKAAGLLAEIRENQRRGEGPRTLREKRDLAEEERQAQEAESGKATVGITLWRYDKLTQVYYDKLIHLYEDPESC
jgi:hypothetical protein